MLNNCYCYLFSFISSPVTINGFALTFYMLYDIAIHLDILFLTDKNANISSTFFKLLFKLELDNFTDARRRRRFVNVAKIHNCVSEFAFVIKHLNKRLDASLERNYIVHQPIISY